MSTRCRSGSLALPPRATRLPALESSGDAGTQSSRQPAPLLSEGGARCLPQAALPRELTHMAPRLEPELHARSWHVVTCTLHPMEWLPGQVPSPFRQLLPASSVQSRERPGALGLPT